MCIVELLALSVVVERGGYIGGTVRLQPNIDEAENSHRPLRCGIIGVVSNGAKICIKIG